MKNQTINESIHDSVESYLTTMDDQEVSDLYELVLSEVEAPLLSCVLKHTGHNQSEAASILGLNRGTLRKKMRKYQLL